MRERTVAPHLTLFAHVALFTGAVYDNAAHEHLAMQLVLALDARRPFSLGDGVDAAQELCAALVPSRATHQLHAPSGVLMVFIEPTCQYGRALATRYALDMTPVDLSDDWAPSSSRPVLDALHASPTHAPWAEARALLEHFAGPVARVRRLDPRVRQMLACLDEDPTLTLAALAARVALSEGRARHLFREVVGAPLRSYRTWLMLRRGLDALRGGLAPSEAAHAAGFADAAHMTRTCRRTLGVTTRTLQGLIGRGS